MDQQFAHSSAHSSPAGGSSARRKGRGGSHQAPTVSPQRFAGVLLFRKAIIFYLTSIAFLAALATHYLYIPTFEAKSMIRVAVENRVNISDVFSSRGYSNYSTSIELGRYMRYLQSEQFLKSVAAELKQHPDHAQLDLTDPRALTILKPIFWDRFLQQHQKRKPTHKDVGVLSDEMVARLIAPLLMTSTDETELITITVTTLDPNTSLAISTVVSETFSKLEKDGEELGEIEKFVRNRYQEVWQRIQETEAKLVDYKKSHSLYVTESPSNFAADRMKTLETELEMQKLAIRENEKRIQYYETLIKNSSGEANELGVKFKIQELQAKNKEISRKINALSDASQVAKNKLSVLPETEQRLHQLKRQLELDYEMYNNLQAKLNGLEIQKFQIKKKAAIEAKAESASQAARVNLWLKLLFSVLVGLFAGCVGALAIEYLDPTIKYTEDLDEMSLEVLGVIPQINPGPKFKGKKGGLFGNKLNNPANNPGMMLVTKTNPTSVDAMAYKYIRARIYAQKDTPAGEARTVLVTSATSGDGKTLTATNLAISFAQLKKRTILIDCDFRNPSVSRILGLPNRRGLASVLTGESTLDEVLVHDESVGLDILCTGWGVNNPTELLSSPAFQDLLANLKHNYDHVIIDSPPVQAVVDPAMIAPMVGTVILVGRYRKTTKDSLAQSHYDLLQFSYRKIYGILNGCDPDSLLLPYGYGYGYGYGQPATSSAPPVSQPAGPRVHTGSITRPVAVPQTVAASQNDPTRQTSTLTKIPPPPTKKIAG